MSMFSKSFVVSYFFIGLSLNIFAGNEIGFIENFSINQNRVDSLKQLIPGTEDYYYYHCLHYQNNLKFDLVEEYLSKWIKRYHYTTKVNEILNRQALLMYKQNPSKTLTRIRATLNLRFNHQKIIADAKKEYPTSLNQTIISFDTLKQRAFSRYKDLSGFSKRGLDFVDLSTLNAQQIRHYLEQISTPDIPNLPRFIVSELRAKYSRGFGSMNIHKKLFLNQLDECLRLMPELKNQTKFVNIYLSRLIPKSFIHWEDNPAEKKIYLERLLKYVRTLDKVHNSLKANIIYNKLKFDISQDIYDENLFMEYIKLPKNNSYVSYEFTKKNRSGLYSINFNADFSNIINLPKIGNDNQLVIDYLQHFFIEDDNFNKYRAYIKDKFLGENFAKSKILNGIGNQEKWYSFLTPSQYNELKEKIEIDFLPINKNFFTVDDKITLSLNIKNVKKLFVKIYQINLQNYYKIKGEEPSLNINLTGLKPNIEKTFEYKEISLKRNKKSFNFPELNSKRGVYIVEFIGNGKSSRAVIKIGQLQYISQLTAAGHTFKIFNNKNQLVKNATISLDGHKYKANKNGNIFIPFSEIVGYSQIIISDGDFCSLDKFWHYDENYKLEKTTFFIDKEALIKGEKANMIVQPFLSNYGFAMPLSLLKNVKLVITSTDRFGIKTNKTIDDFKLYSDKESTYEFMVPSDLSDIKVSLNAEVRSISRGKDMKLSVSESFLKINEIDKSDKITQVLLSKVDNKYILNVLGKNGESKVSYPVNIDLVHKCFKNRIQSTLKTDKNGQVQLGELKDIDSFKVQYGDKQSRDWKLSKDKKYIKSEINTVLHQDILIPYVGSSSKVSNKEFQLIELRTGQINYANRLEFMSIKDGFIIIKDLPQGKYTFLNKGSINKIYIEVTAGTQYKNYVFSENNIIKLTNPKPLQITKIQNNNKELIVDIKNISKNTRVHIIATKYIPEYSIFGRLNRFDFPPNEISMISFNTKSFSQYQSGINTGDEFNYILNRKYTKIYPGNMLKRPGLLLNPFKLNDTTIEGAKALQTSGSFKEDTAEHKSRRSKAGSMSWRRLMKSKSFRGRTSNQSSPTFDFLAQSAITFYNERPNKDGKIIINLEKFGDKHEITIVAIDKESIIMRKTFLSKKVANYADQRLIDILDSKKHYLEEKKISTLKKGEEIVLKDVTPTSFYMFDNLSSVHTIYKTLLKQKKDANKLSEFAFVLKWNSMSDKEKIEKYSKYSCHELNYFIYKKDKEFFDKVIISFLKNKKNKTFLDKWFLKNDLNEFLKPNLYINRLNIFEKILLASTTNNETLSTQRFVKDAYNMIPFNPVQHSHIFDTALKLSALDTNSIASSLLPRVQGSRMKNKKLGNGMQIEGVRSSRINSAPRKSLRQKKSLKKFEMGSISVESPDVTYATMDGFGDFADEKEVELAREAIKTFYQKLPKTEELAENNYYKLPIELQNSKLVKVNGLWQDCANNLSEKDDVNILSAHFAEANMNFTEIMLALSTNNLPFKGEKHSFEFDNNNLTIKTASNAILFHKEVSEVEAIEKQKIIVSQNYFDVQDKFNYIDNKQIRKFITNNELLIDKVYGCHIVITNPTTEHYKINILMQIPKGAIPVNNGFRTKTFYKYLQPYKTETVEYLFYFPKIGKFPHFPAHIANSDKLLGYSTGNVLNVVNKLTTINKTSWEYISQNGSNDDVFSYLETHNLNRIDLEKIAFRMKDKDFFDMTIKLLNKYHTYNNTLWSYSVFHNDDKIIPKFLETTRFPQSCGEYIKSDLLNINPVENLSYQHLEYNPLINARVYKIGKKKEILNNNIFKQYNKFLKILSYKSKLNDMDLMSLTYYLLIQDRIELAISFFKQVNKENLKSDIQYDYFSAYIAFYEEDVQKAAQIAKKYVDYPVLRWKNKFAEILNQLDEISGAKPVVLDNDDRATKMTQLAAGSHSVSLTIEGEKVVIYHENITECNINYYLMDIEFLFSKNPTVKNYGEQFSYIKPNHSVHLKLDKNKKATEFIIPEKYQTSNILIEIQSPSMSQSDFKTYFANSMNVKVEENYGQIKVTSQEAAKALSKVYVKVYAKLKNGETEFYKDGYTDLRGRFDYASISNDMINNVDSLSILIISEEYGAVIKEVQPPKQ